MASITGSTSAGSFTITPDEFPGWGETSTANNVVHQFIGGGVGVSIIPPKPPAGTVELRFFVLSDAVSARDALRGMTGAGTLTASGSPSSSGLDFVVSGDIGLTADMSGAQPMWSVTFAYQGLT